MPLFMDVHTIKGGVGIGEVAEAHGADLKIQDKHDLRSLRYWVDDSPARSSAWSRRRRLPRRGASGGSRFGRRRRLQGARGRLTLSLMKEL
jgi:hypothetical protein